MPRHPKCAKLRDDANSNRWPEMLAFYCHRASVEDIQIAREINELCIKLSRVITERGRLIEELQTVENMYVKKTLEHLRESQLKDDQKFMHMETMKDELDLSARDKDVFILKLKGLMEF